LPKSVETAVIYKDHWGRVLAERARSGATGPEPVPHPDDVIIDSETGEVRYDGPVNEEQKATQKWLRARWPDLERCLMQINEQLESDPKNSELRKQQRGSREDRWLASRRRTETYHARCTTILGRSCGYGNRGL
jgi:hypothetical protein